MIRLSVRLSACDRLRMASAVRPANNGRRQRISRGFNPDLGVSVHHQRGHPDHVRRRRPLLQPHVFPAGTGSIEADTAAHNHLLRNETNSVAQTIVTFLAPVGP